MTDSRSAGRFERFYKADSARASAGSGLGLAIALENARLLAGPSSAGSAAGLRSLIPAGTHLLGLTVSSGTATVDLSSSFISAASPSTMPLRIAHAVYTLAQFPTVTGVQFD